MVIDINVLTRGVAGAFSCIIQTLSCHDAGPPLLRKRVALNLDGIALKRSHPQDPITIALPEWLISWSRDSSTMSRSCVVRITSSVNSQPRYIYMQYLLKCIYVQTAMNIFDLNKPTWCGSYPHIPTYKKQVHRHHPDASRWAWMYHSSV